MRHIPLVSVRSRGPRVNITSASGSVVQPAHSMPDFEPLAKGFGTDSVHRPTRPTSSRWGSVRPDTRTALAAGSTVFARRRRLFGRRLGRKDGQAASRLLNRFGRRLGRMRRMHGEL